MKGIDTLPPGPLLKNYDFSITYYEQPIDELYRATVTSRLMAGMTPLQAVRGTPLTVQKAVRWRNHLNLTRKDEKAEYRTIGTTELDGFDIVHLFYHEKLSMREIARIAGCGSTAIFHALKRMGVNDAREFRRKHVSRSQKAIARKATAARKVKAAKWRANPWNSKYEKWLKKRGYKLLPAYEDIANGMPIYHALKKHRISYKTARHNFKKWQKRLGKFLEYGERTTYGIRVTRVMWQTWEKAAKEEDIIVLDWIKKHLNRAASRHAGSQPTDYRPDTGYDRVPEVTESRGKVGSLLQSLRSVHERPPAAKPDGSSAGIEDATSPADAPRAKQGVGANATSAEVDYQHGSERKADQHSQSG